MSVLRHRTFALVWTGQVLSVVGDGMRMLVLIWLAKTRSGSNTVVVVVAVAIAVPIVLGSPLGGWAADRFDRSRLLIAADAHRALISALLAGMLFTDRLTTGWLCVLVALTSCGAALSEPTFNAVLPTLVPDDERTAANALTMASTAGGSIVGPLAGGALMAGVGPGWVLVIDAASFVWSGILVAIARVPQPHLANTPARANTPATDGQKPASSLGLVLASGVVRRLGGLACALNFLVAPLTVFLVVLAVDKHHVGARTYGVLEMTIPAGILVGSMLASRFARFRWTLVGSLLTIGVLLAAIGIAPLTGVMVALVAVGVCLALANTLIITMFQDSVPAEVRGRAFGVVGALSMGLRPTGLLIAGPVLATVGIEWGFAAVGTCVVLATIAWARPDQLHDTAVGSERALTHEQLVAEPSEATGRGLRENRGYG
jgi:MFS transporter, DHA3 family, macrolide efflux protein